MPRRSSIISSGVSRLVKVLHTVAHQEMWLATSGEDSQDNAPDVPDLSLIRFRAGGALLRVFGVIAMNLSMANWGDGIGVFGK